jgi:outer membrane protein assembly factor BamB
MGKRRTVLGLVILAAIVWAPRGLGSAGVADWTQWGGPNRNFIADATGLASSWPSEGPPRLWSRRLGEGHSAILAEGGRLYTMYRPLGLLSLVWRSREEVVTALDAATGNTIWEFTYPAPTTGRDFAEGAGPHSTPLIVGNRLYALSSRNELFALDKATGRLLWSHDFAKEYGASGNYRGATCSPLSYKGTIIVVMEGGPGQAVAAFDQQTGALVWKAGDDSSPASPILIDVDGQTQLVVLGGNQVFGFDPATGRQLWSHPHKTQYGLNISTPVWSAGSLFLSAAYGTGTRAVEVRQVAGKSTVSERWASTRMRVHFGTVIGLDGYVYGSSGDFGPAFITAVDMKSGRIVWQDRTFARAQLIYADGKLIVLDEDGTLGLATIESQGLKVLARAPILTSVSWTPPTLAGTTLYVRDRKTIAAYNLSARR